MRLVQNKGSGIMMLTEAKFFIFLLKGSLLFSLKKNFQGNFEHFIM